MIKPAIDPHEKQGLMNLNSLCRCHIIMRHMINQAMPNDVSTLGLTTWARRQVEGLGYFQSALQILPSSLVHC